MHMLTFLLPCFLLVHNTVDFRPNGACESYLNCLNVAVTTYVEMLEDNNRLRLVNKTGNMDTTIHSLGLQFEAYDPQDINGARFMVLQLLDSFTAYINQFERLKPFLCPYPFTQDNVEIRINFVDNCKYAYPQPGQIKYVIYSEGKITYMTQNTRYLGEMQKLRDEPIEFSRRTAGSYPAVAEWRKCPPVPR